MASKNVLISAEVPRDLRDNCKKYGINMSDVVRKALQKKLDDEMSGDYSDLFGETRADTERN